MLATDDWRLTTDFMAHENSKPASLLIKGGHVIDPANRIDALMDMLLRDGQVAEVALPNKIRGSTEEKFDARGLVVAPGFIDLHVHLLERSELQRRRLLQARQPQLPGASRRCVACRTRSR